MKTIDSLSPLLDENFSEFTDASKIVICYRTTGLFAGVTKKPLPVIVSVNGFPSIALLAGHLNDLKSKFLSSVVETEQNLKSGARLFYLRLALLRCEKLSSVVAPMQVICHYDESETEVVNTCLMFRDPVCVNSENPGEPVAEPDAIQRLTSHHAALWHHTFSEIRMELQVYVELAGDSSSPFAGEQKGLPAVKHSEKLMVITSVALLAAFCRILYDSDVFGFKNRAKFCRILTNWVCTNSQPGISSISFKHHFDDPSPENMKKVHAKLCKLQQNIQKFIYF